MFKSVSNLQQKLYSIVQLTIHSVVLSMFLIFRFGAFEELKKRNASADGTLAPNKRLLCGLGTVNFIIFVHKIFINT
jgi:hypothetical protein